jgi:YHS domain-containing protein
MKQRLTVTLAAAIAAAVSLAAFQSAAPAQAAIGGYCPVAYAAMNKAVKGDPAHKATYNGQTFLFSNAEAVKMFQAAPAKYAPAFEGYCTTAVSMGMKVESKPTLFAVHEGKTYLFSSDEAKATFEKDKAGVIAKANTNWPKVKQAK